jgi:hypothetical protein
MPNDEEEIARPQNERSSLRTWWPRALYVVVPALIAGFFSIAPKLYDELTKPRAVLSYTETSGPAISTGAGFRRIYSIAAENEGKLPLTGIDLDIRPTAGAQIESQAVETSAGLSPVTTSANDSYKVHLERLLPTETISTSVLTVSSVSDTQLKIALRSNEVLGAPRVSAGATPSNDLLVSGVLAALSVGIALSVLPYLFSRGVLPLFRVPPTASEPHDTIRYIALLSGLSSLPQNVVTGERELTFIGAADVFLASGLRAGADDRKRSVLALRALLTVYPRIRPSSAQAIKANLETLGYHLSNEELGSLRKQATLPSTTLQVRQRIEAFLKATE